MGNENWGSHSEGLILEELSTPSKDRPKDFTSGIKSLDRSDRKRSISNPNIKKVIKLNSKRPSTLPKDAENMLGRDKEDDHDDEIHSDSDEDDDDDSGSSMIRVTPKKMEEKNEKKKKAEKEKAEKKKEEDSGGIGISIDDTKMSIVRHPISDNDFERIRVIGKGKFGKVILVKEKKTGLFYAMKIMKKSYIVKRHLTEQVKSERLLLAGCNFPFVVKLKYAFTDKTSIFLIMEYINGGELFWHLKKEGSFDEERSKFYAAEMYLAISYLHRNKIIHRDIKPENILIDKDGHCVLTDFGLSKVMKNRRQLNRTFCGTPEYLAPEMVACQSRKFRYYTKSIDWWGFGVFIYEMLVGSAPFEGKDLFEKYQQICEKKITFPKNLKISNSAKDIVLKLLERNPRKRLGTRNHEDIKNHDFFKGIDFQKVLEKKITPPFIPQVSGTDDVKYISKKVLDLPVYSIRKPLKIKQLKEFEKMFENFYLEQDMLRKKKKEKMKKERESMKKLKKKEKEKEPRWKKSLKESIKNEKNNKKKSLKEKIEESKGKKK